MPVILGSAPLAGFDQPIQLLKDCHRRIERFLHALVAVSAARRGGDLSPEERDALRGATEYFRSAAPRHTLDEEESLFPLMRASGDPRVAGALRDLARLESDHDAADQKHAEVNRLVDRWLECGRLDEDSVCRLCLRLGELQAMYRDHIALEDDCVFPLAAAVLTHRQLNRVGDEMARRRGVAVRSVETPDEGNR